MPTNIPLPALKWGKRKTRSQMCEVFTIDGRWIDKEMPAFHSYMSVEEWTMAFLIDSNNQYQAEDGTWHQLITEKSQIPICLMQANVYQDGKDDEKELKELSDQIFKLTDEQAQAEQFAKAGKSEIWNKIMWIISIVCGTFLIVAAFSYFGG